MTKTRFLMLVPAAMLAVACGGRKDTSSADAALQNDLALASQAQPYMPQQTLSPAEMGLQYNPYTGQYQRVPTQYTPAAPAVQRVYTQPASTRSSSSGSSRVYTPAPAPEPIRHTKRDAAIGAAAGAVIGATTSRDRVKGGIIGAVAGGVLGGIIGHTVDVQKPY
jgi:hypothetical protein